LSTLTQGKYIQGYSTNAGQNNACLQSPLRTCDSALIILKNNKAMSIIDFTTVSELAGDKVSRQQIDRACHRYCWASMFCRDKDVLEVACASGHGLGMLARTARSLKAGDFTEKMLRMARLHYGDRIELSQFDARAIPYSDRSFDVIILFEAIYYVPSVEKLGQSGFLNR